MDDEEDLNLKNEYQDILSTEDCLLQVLMQMEKELEQDQKEDK